MQILPLSSANVAVVARQKQVSALLYMYSTDYLALCEAGEATEQGRLSEWLRSLFQGRMRVCARWFESNIDYNPHKIAWPSLVRQWI